MGARLNDKPQFSKNLLTILMVAVIYAVVSYLVYSEVPAVSYPNMLISIFRLYHPRVS